MNTANDNIIPFVPVEVGDGYKFDADEVLEEAKGQDFIRLVLVGEKPDGEVYVAASDGIAESLLLFERGKMKILGV